MTFEELKPDQADYNPYAPPLEINGVPTGPAQDRDFRNRSWLRSFGTWSLVCIISALPSFGWGIGTIASEQVAAMLMGIFIFILGYTFADQLTQWLHWRRNRSFRLTMKIGYISRLVVSIVFPIGGFIDMFCGIFSVGCVSAIVNSAMGEPGLPGNEPSFLITLLITLVQGTVLNVVLAGYMAIVFGFVVLVHRNHAPGWQPPIDPSNFPPTS